MQHLVETYGYLALFIGTFLEGETILVIGGFMAFRGYLDIRWVILLAMIGSMTGDQLLFYIGRKKGKPFIARRPKWQARVDRIQSLLERWQDYIVLGFRFFYGLRNVTPFVIGSIGYPPKRFLVLNAAGAALWAVVGGGGGYVFGRAVELILKDIRKYELWLLAAIAATSTLLLLFHLLKPVFSRKKPSLPEQQVM